MAIDVKAIAWPYRYKTPKDPDATLDYQLDWSGWLVEGESIIALEVLVVGVNLEETTSTINSTTAWVSGGTVGNQASITFRVTTDSYPVNRKDDRTLILKIGDR